MTANGVAAWKDLDGDGVATATLNSGSSVSAESDVPNLVADLALKAPLASPTLTGTPSLPTGTTGVTQSAGDSSTKLATTAFVTTADNLKADLAGPTFTGTPTLPTGTIGTTQSANDSSTKLATTAFVTTADNLKANLAGPTFTGTVTLPSTTVAVTPSASDNSTKPATTAYVDTADALKANLAGPTFTGVVTLPTGAVATTQTGGTNNTTLATTAYVDKYRPSFFINGSNNNISQTVDARSPIVATQAVAATGIMNNWAIELYAGQVITNITFKVGTTAGTAQHWWVALYDTQATPALIAQSNDQTTAALTANTVQTIPLASPAPYTVTTSGAYYVSVMFAATTMPTVYGLATSNTTRFLAGMKVLGSTSGSSLTTTAPGTIASPSAVSNSALVYTS